MENEIKRPVGRPRGLNYKPKPTEKRPPGRPKTKIGDDTKARGYNVSLTPGEKLKIDSLYGSCTAAIKSLLQAE